MTLISATDVAIRIALANGTLTVTERASRFPGETYFAISDARGLIEVHLTRAEVDSRIAAIRNQ